MRFSAMLLALISMPALACPNLAGVYKTCTTTSDQTEAPTEMTVTQKIVRSATEFTLTTVSADPSEAPMTETYRADGKAVVLSQTDADSGMTMKTTTTTSCLGNDVNLKIDISMLTPEVVSVGKIAMKIYKDGHKMIQVITGEVFAEQINETTTCE